MNKKNIIPLFMPVMYFAASAQLSSLPVKEWPSAGQTPFVLYTSGDGGLNNFSNTLCTAINKAGYSVTAVNAKSYFWDKKTPAQTATAIAAYLETKFQNRNNQQLVLIGYSFGADVMPFVVNKLAVAIKNKLVSLILVSPSTSTDLEIHWSDIFGGSTKRSMDVVAEINKMNVLKIITFFGAQEGNFPVKDIRLKNYHNQTLPGGHHFEGHIDELAQTMIKEFQ